MRFFYALFVREYFLTFALYLITAAAFQRLTCSSTVRFRFTNCTGFEAYEGLSFRVGVVPFFLCFCIRPIGRI